MISDDGIGIPDEKLQTPDIGLDAMQSRARLIGARLEFARGARGGTIITCTWPMNRDEKRKRSKGRRSRGR
jgi:signal transduction histidine kinase